jgi:membrane-bound lytic murein transglycosylase A
MIQVQGSAQVRLTDGTSVNVGFAGSNGRDHVGLGTQLMNEGKLDKRHVSLPAVLAYFDQHPDELNEYILRDDRFTFQKIYTSAEAAEWPTGSLNVQVTTDRTIATDKNSNPAIFPRASFVFMDVAQPSASGVMAPKQSFVLDQDNGGGIRAAGRADIYMGIGPLAGQRAGDEFAEGHLYYIFLKPEMIDPAKQPDVRAAVRRVQPPVSSPTGSPVAPPPARGNGGGEMFPGAVAPR